MSLFPHSSKRSACQCRRCRFDPWVGKIPWRREWQPAPIFLLGESHGQRTLVGYSPRGSQGVEHDLVIKNNGNKFRFCPGVLCELGTWRGEQRWPPPPGRWCFWPVTQQGSVAVPHLLTHPPPHCPIHLAHVVILETGLSWAAGVPTFALTVTVPLCDLRQDT